MSTYSISYRYAKSFVELSQEKNNLEKVVDDMRQLLKIYGESKDFRLLLNNPIISGIRKKEILAKTFEGKLDKITLRIIALLTRKRREIYLKSIAREFINTYNDIKGLKHVTVVTCNPLNKEQEKEVSKYVKRVTQKIPVLEKVINSNLIGGFVLNFEDKKIDFSVSGKIKDIKLKLNS